MVKVPRVLFLHANQPCYVAEPLFHGLRTLLGMECLDVPRYDSMYRPLPPSLREKLRGHGFSLYGLLPEIPEMAADRYSWKSQLDSWDLVVIANIWDQGDLYLDLHRRIAPEKLILVDGYDTPALFPFAYRFSSRPWFYSAALRKNPYFKRELTNGGDALGLHRFLPSNLLKKIRVPRLTFPISFSIPREKIRFSPSEFKTKDFPKHIVDEEVAAKVRGAFHSSIGSNRYVFENEDEYYSDLAISRYGITTCRAGWDCLRHYELAANGCVLCFKDLHLKPETCAPHGLGPENCVSYRNYDDLQDKLSRIDRSIYDGLQKKTYAWLNENTTVARAGQFLSKLVPGYNKRTEDVLRGDQA